MVEAVPNCERCFMGHTILHSYHLSYPKPSYRYGNTYETPQRRQPKYPHHPIPPRQGSKRRHQHCHGPSVQRCVFANPLPHVEWPTTPKNCGTIFPSILPGSGALGNFPWKCQPEMKIMGQPSLHDLGFQPLNIRGVSTWENVYVFFFFGGGVEVRWR